MNRSCFISFNFVFRVFFPGVIAVSWYPPNMKDENGHPTDDIVPLLLEVAHKYHIKVCMKIVVQWIDWMLQSSL